MAKKIYLHIGTMKSATSYLQALCNCNIDTLADQGVLWPWTARNFSAISDLLGSNEDRPGVAGAWGKLKARLDHWEGDALISNELLAARALPGITQVVEALAPAEIHIIITARDLARTLPSQWQTRMRNRHTHPFNDFVADLMDGTNHPETVAFWRRQNLPAIVKRFSKVVPPQDISLVTVPPAGADPAVIGQRFLSVLGIDAENIVQPARSNSSLGAHSAELMRRLNTQLADLDPEQYRWAFNNTLAKLVLSDRASREPPLALTPEQLTWTHQRGRKMVNGLSETGINVVGDLSDLIPVLPDQATSGESVARDAGSDDAAMLDVSIDALAGMGKLLGELRVEHEALLDQLTQRFETKQQAEISAATKTAYHETGGAPGQYLLRTKLIRKQLDAEHE